MACATFIIVSSCWFACRRRGRQMLQAALAALAALAVQAAQAVQAVQAVRGEVCVGT